MGFDWVQAISVGASIDAADLIEIRTNVDTVDDEKCAAHKVNVKFDYKDGDDTSYNYPYCSGQNSYYFPGDYSGYMGNYDIQALP